MINKIPLTEHQIQDLLIQYLQMKGYYVQRMNSGQMRVQSIKKVRYGKQVFDVPIERNIMMGMAGTPDIMAFRTKTVQCPVAYKAEHYIPSLLFVEVKRPGNKPTSIQKAKMEELERYGADCIVATCIEDLQKEGI